LSPAAEQESYSPSNGNHRIAVTAGLQQKQKVKVGTKDPTLVGGLNRR
jgi:hypothetical protein